MGKASPEGRALSPVLLMAQEEDFGALAGELFTDGSTSICRTVINNDQLQGNAML